MADGVVTSSSTPNKQPTPLKAGKGKKMPAGKGRYTIGGKGTHGCSGYPVVGGEGAVHGCHKTRSAAMRQQAAIYASENQAEKAAIILELVKAQEMIDELGSYFGVEDVEKSAEVEEQAEVVEAAELIEVEEVEEPVVVKDLSAIFEKSSIPTRSKYGSTMGNGTVSLEIFNTRR